MFLEKRKADPTLPCPDSIGAMFLLIARKFVSRWNFNNPTAYSNREDMISFGIEYCLRYMGNFTLEISDNPFSFFTQIIKSAFYQTLNTENRKRDTVTNAKEKLASETCTPVIRGNIRFFRPNERSIEEIIDEQEIKAEIAKRKIILWEDELVIQNLNTDFIDTFFKENK
jgi:hypothetical protein